jgi:hypothetical protein
MPAMDSTQLRNIAFLMSLGGLSLACPGDEKNDSDSATGTGNGSDGTTTGGPETSTSGTPTTSGTTGGSGTSTATGTTGGVDTTGTPTTSGTTGISTETGDPSAGFVTTRGSTGEGTSEGTTGEPLPEVQACTDFGDKFAMCFPRDRMYAAEYTMYCQMIFSVGEPDGPDCTAALEEFFACVNGLECKDYEAELMTPAMCKTQFEASNAACPSLGG